MMGLLLFESLSLPVHLHARFTSDCLSPRLPDVPAGRQQAERELLPQLVSALLALAAHRPSAAVRETALQCLMLLLEMPYTALHPYRRAVGAALAVAVDDNRRAVRLQAVRCRQAWSAA